MLIIIFLLLRDRAINPRKDNQRVLRITGLRRRNQRRHRVFIARQVQFDRFGYLVSTRRIQKGLCLSLAQFAQATSYNATHDLVPDSAAALAASAADEQTAIVAWVKVGCEERT